MAIADWRVPDARRVLSADAQRHEWLAARRQGIGGSDVPAIMEVSPYAGPLTIWRDKTGRFTEEPDPDDPALWFGHHLEPVVTQRFTLETNLTTRPGGLFRNNRTPWMLATPDRLTSDGGGLEIKTTSLRSAGQWENGAIPDAAELQAHWYMAVTGRAPWHVACLIDTNRLVLRTVEPNPGLLDVLYKRIQSFWVECVKADVPPRASAGDVDTLQVTHQPIPGRHTVAKGAAALITRYRQARANLRHAEEHAEDVRAEVLQTLGDSTSLGPDAETIWLRVESTDPSYGKLAADYPDLAKHYVRTSTRRKVCDSLGSDHPEIAARISGRRITVTGDGRKITADSSDFEGPAVIPSQRSLENSLEQEGI